MALIFGQKGGYPTNIDLDTLGSAGVVIRGQQNFDLLGASVNAAGDVNGDNFDDFIISAPGNDQGSPGSEVGAAYVVFGRSSWNPTLLLGALNGTNGFKIVGDNARTGTNGIGEVVGGFNIVGASGGGDFNGDGFDDVIVASSQYKLFTNSEGGAAFIIFGKASAFTTPIVVSALDGTNGIAIGSSTQNDHMGLHAGFVGDVNQDGLTDISISNHEETQADRRTFIIFGKATGNPAAIDVNGLTAAQGFALPEFTNKDFIGPLEYGADVTMRDIDGDGDLDLGVSVTTFNFKNLATYQGYTFAKNKGDGFSVNPFGKSKNEFRQVLFGMSNVGVDDQRVDIGDFNGDGRYDLVAYQPFLDSPVPTVYYGEKPTGSYQIDNVKNSSGVFFTGFPAAGGDGSFDPIPRFIGDINGDGIDDILLTPPPGEVVGNAFIVFGSGVKISKDGKKATYLDADGDKVTVKTTKGKFTLDMFTMSHPDGAVDRGQRLDLLDLSLGGQAFNRADITVSVTKANGGNGLANVLAINAAGIDLRNVKINGALGSIDAGNDDFDKGGINKLDVKRLGLFENSGAVDDSDVAGRIGTIKVKTDVDNAIVNVTGKDQGVSFIDIDGNFSGEFTFEGPLKEFSSADVLAMAKLIVLGDQAEGANITTKISTKTIADGALVQIEGVIEKLKTKDVGHATIVADRIEKLETKGFFAADVTLDNDGASGATKSLGKATISGLFFDGTILSAGSVGSFMVGAMQNAALFVGFTPSAPGTPLAGGTFTADALLGSFEVTGKATITGGSTAMVDSFVVSTELGKSNVKSMDDLTGSTDWGFAYRDTIKSLKVKTPAFTYDTALGGTQELNHFGVTKLT